MEHLFSSFGFRWAQIWNTLYISLNLYRHNVPSSGPRYDFDTSVVGRTKWLLIFSLD